MYPRTEILAAKRRCKKVVEISTSTPNSKRRRPRRRHCPAPRPLNMTRTTDILVETEARLQRQLYIHESFVIGDEYPPTPPTQLQIPSPISHLNPIPNPNPPSIPTPPSSVIVEPLQTIIPFTSPAGSTRLFDVVRIEL